MKDTDYNERLLSYITTYVKEYHVPPTVDQMIENVPGLSSKSSVHYRLQKLVDHGLLVQKNKKGYYYPASLDERTYIVPEQFLISVIDLLNEFPMSEKRMQVMNLLKVITST